MRENVLLTNAEEELLDLLDKHKDLIRCAEIDYEHGDWGKLKTIKYRLLDDSTPKEKEDFFNELDFDYDSGYGTQELSGTVWCKDGVWYERGEYDGSEWWERHVYPEIPKKLIK